MSTALLASLPRAFTHADAKSLGISDRDLYSWRDQGAIETLGRGLYLRPGIEVDTDLIELSIRAPRATLCLTSALSRHGLVDDIPAVIDVALPRELRQPQTDVPVRWHRFDASTFLIDRTELDVGAGRVLGLYGPRRCIVDAFRLRHIYGTEQAVLAMRKWLTLRESQPSDLLLIAVSFPAAERAIRNALEILL
jgi:predicted transcriptional regulator of viral defense system